MLFEGSGVYVVQVRPFMSPTTAQGFDDVRSGECSIYSHQDYDGMSFSARTRVNVTESRSLAVH